MPFCVRCSHEIPPEGRFCPACGAASVHPSIELTQMATPSAEPSARAGRTGATSGTTSSGLRGRFLPGSVLAERYRIVDLAGTGGMGEVYRADDLKLEQLVALKFLPESVEGDASRLQRLIGEVRLARQIAHPNVCRVYDIGEADGRHFLSMEFVDGEDLGSLLRRIGHLPKEKAIQIARQLCAGLAAAHDQGILHRDLKPANVMIDGRGRARITDFGLAIATGDASGEEGIAGTPAYMAPEQRAGGELSVRSDLYALGLVLYEIFTGRQAFDSTSWEESKRSQSSSRPPTPSSLVDGFDPAVERAILRCLEPDPRDRPASAFEVAVALPGGDPVAAALAAGETPSPEMVAASGGEGAISLRRAGALAGTAALFTAAVLAIAPYSMDLGLAPWTEAPTVLEAKARELLADLGYRDPPGDSESSITRDYAPMEYFSRQKTSPEWRGEMRQWGPPLALRYRQSPAALVPRNLDGNVLADDPPHDVPGMAMVRMAGGDRVTQFLVVPPDHDTTTGSVAQADWSPLLGAAGLSEAELEPVAPEWVPPVPFDERAEWTTAAPWFHEVPLRVSAAAWRGRPVYFEVRGPWSKPQEVAGVETELRVRIAQAAAGIVFLALLAGTAFFAIRNVRQGRGDRRGAWRFALFTFGMVMIDWVVTGHHVTSFLAELGLFMGRLGLSVLVAALFAAIYLAVEPYVRRHTPELMIGWARLLEGRIRDPRVGRDILIGAAVGAITALLLHLPNALPSWMPLQGQTTMPANGVFLESPVAGVPSLIGGPLIEGFVIFGLYFLLRVLLRRALWAGLALTLLLSIFLLGGENPMIEVPSGLLRAGVLALVAVRYGLLAIVSVQFFHGILTRAPLPVDLSAPYATATLVLLGVFVIIAGFAFRTSLGAKPAFRLALDE